MSSPKRPESGAGSTIIDVEDDAPTPHEVSVLPPDADEPGSTAVVLSDSRAQQEFLRSAEQAAQGIGRLLRDAITSILTQCGQCSKKSEPHPRQMGQMPSAAESSC